MSDLKAKCTNIDFRRGSTADPAGGAYSAPLNPLLDLRGLIVRGRKRRRRKREERGGASALRWYGPPTG